MQIRAGTGGDEAALFVGDLLRMYQRYAEEQSWKISFLSESVSENGGLKEAIVQVRFGITFSHPQHCLPVHCKGNVEQGLPATRSLYCLKPLGVEFLLFRQIYTGRKHCLGMVCVAVTQCAYRYHLLTELWGRLQVSRRAVYSKLKYERNAQSAEMSCYRVALQSAYIDGNSGCHARGR